MENGLHDLDVGRLLTERGPEAMALNQRYLNPQLGRVLQTLGFHREWVQGKGAYLIDRTGARYLDLLSGYGVFSLGRNHPAVKAQLMRALEADTPSLSQLGVSTLPGVLGEELIARAPKSLEAVLLTSSGTEAVEGALKLARAATRRRRLLFCERGFHGLSLGALSVNGNEEFRERFGPLLPGDSVPFGDLDALAGELGRGDVAAFIVEPIQGKGVYLAPEGYLQGAQELCRRHGTLLILDEVQTGLGRTGRFLALEHWGVEPDLVTLSKALSGGYVPLGAVLASRKVFQGTFDSMERSVVHGSTFGGGDLAAAAGLATLKVLDEERLVERADQLGELLMDADAAAGAAVRGGARGPGPRPDVGRGAGATGGAGRPQDVGRDRAPPARAVRSDGYRAAVPRAPDPHPGGGPPHERGQGARPADHRGE